MIKHFLTFIIIGIFYLGVEVIDRVFIGELVGLYGWTKLSLVGWSSVWMIPVGGLCGLVIGMFNENKKFWKLPMLVQSLIGVAVVLLIELTTGLILNVWLKLNIWDYSNAFLNLFGQISFRTGLLFFLLTPFAIWFDDLLRCGLYKNKSVYPFLENYIRLFTLK